MVILYHCLIADIKIKNCKAVWARCPYWFTPCIGEAPKKSRCESPICYAVLYILPVLTQHQYKKPYSCLPVPYSFSASSSMGTCFTEGGVSDMQGNLGDPRPFTAKNTSYLGSTVWSTQVSEYPREYLCT